MDRPPQPDGPDASVPALTKQALASRYPFVPYGLVPLAGLLALMFIALAPFAFGEVQAVTEATARAALQKSGATWATAAASGQWVVLEGRPPSREAAAEAERVVRQARADTLFGPAAPATWVISHFTWVEDPLAPPATAPQRPGAATPPAVAQAEAEACDQTMASLLATARIEFATNSAGIGVRSSALLDSIASAVGNCRGSLQIEGHTDNVGRAAANTALSLRRAEAVRTALIARGVSADRLVAEGFGATRPLASNRTENGRAQNRRIEIRTLRSSPA